MIEVIILDRDPSGIIDIVKDLRSAGLKQGQDFDFAYKPPEWDSFSGDAVYNRRTIFTFYTEELASWFALKYSYEIQKRH